MKYNPPQDPIEAYPGKFKELALASAAAAPAAAVAAGGGKKSKKTAAPEKTYLPDLHKCPDGRSRKAFRVKGKGNTIYVVYKGVVTAVKKIK